MRRNDNCAGERSDKFCEKKPWGLIAAVYVAPYLMLVAIAFYWPSDSEFLGIDFRSAWLAYNVPSISGYIENSKFPAATAAYLVLSGVLFLPYLLLGIVNPISVVFFGSYRSMMEARNKANSRPLFVRLLAFVYCFAMIWIMWWQPGYQFGWLPINDQRWALAFGGVLLGFFTTSYFWLNGAVVCVRCFLKPTFERK
ncbi:hypothetical protein [Cupriavidus sp. DL-D2]|uniref:hypothetical protein n=1 Tax=Cupriavidus sp. DL-D2 TaxID=3144974 RepID=UPI003214919F